MSVSGLDVRVGIEVKSNVSASLPLRPTDLRVSHHSNASYPWALLSTNRPTEVLLVLLGPPGAHLANSIPFGPTERVPSPPPSLERNQVVFALPSSADPLVTCLTCQRLPRPAIYFQFKSIHPSQGPKKKPCETGCRNRVAIVLAKHAAPRELWTLIISESQWKENCGAGVGQTAT